MYRTIVASGMVAWKGQFTPEQVEAMRMYVIQRANEDKELEQR